MIQQIQHRQRRRRRLPKVGIVAVAIFAISIWVMVIMFWFSHSTLQHHVDGSHPANNKDPAKGDKVSLHQVAYHSMLEKLWPDDDADSFFVALLDCYEECTAQEKPPKKIAILYPPGQMGLEFVDLVKKIVLAHYHSSSPSDQEVLWVPTSHVPSPADGYSHIIRFANLPILLAAGDALFSTKGSDKKADKVITTWKDVEETAELIVSWHCWISSVAEKQTTPVVSITMHQLEDSQLEVETSIRDFINLLMPYEDDPEGHIDALKQTTKMQKMIDNIQAMLIPIDQKLRKEGGRRKAGQHNQNLQVLVNHVIRQYLTEDLQCPTFEGPGEYLHTPKETSSTATRLVDLVQPVYDTSLTLYENDLKWCNDNNDSSLSSSLFCKNLIKPFSMKSLLESNKG